MSAGMDWQISDNKFNQFIYGSTVQDYSFPRPSNPEGIYQISFATGTTTLLDDPYSSPSNAQARRVPIPEVKDNFTWNLGRHSSRWAVISNGFSPTIRPLSAITPTPSVWEAMFRGLNASCARPISLPRAVPPRLPMTAPSPPCWDASAPTSTFNYDAAGQALPAALQHRQDYRYYQTQPYIATPGRSPRT